MKRIVQVLMVVLPLFYFTVERYGTYLSGNGIGFTTMALCKANAQANVNNYPESVATCYNANSPAVGQVVITPQPTP
jgi:hypothetical protein